MRCEDGKGQVHNWLVSGGRGWWFLRDAAAAVAVAAEMVHAMLWRR